MKLQYTKTKENALINAPAYEGDVGYDLFSTEDIHLKVGERHKTSTGLKFNIEKGYFMKVEEKSGKTINNGYTVHGGIIDNGYKGEIHVIVFNATNHEIHINKGDKIAQLIVYHRNILELEEVESIDDDESERGEKGFGSSGN